jgi:hypothetical protein
MQFSKVCSSVTRSSSQVAARRSFSEVFCVDRDATLGRHLYQLGDRPWDIPDLRHLLEA